MGARGAVRARASVRVLLAFAVAVPTILSAPADVGGTPASVQRLAGADRYATAAAISADAFAPGVATAFVATGTTFPDSLAGGPAAARRGGPILLTAPNDLPAATQAELRRLAPREIVLLGGTAAISRSVETKLASFTAGGVIRVAGADRYATAAAISARYFGRGAPVAYVATGRSFPDALTAGAAAARLGGPVLLVGRDRIPTSIRTELGRLAPKRIVVVGGTSVVGDAVLAALRAYTTGGVTRQAGADRYATAAAISAATFGRDSGLTVHLASGLGFADAVAGVPAAAKRGGPLLIAARTWLPGPIATELRRLDPTRVVLLGGEAALASSLVQEVRSATIYARVGPHEFIADGYSLQKVPADLLAYNSTRLVELYGNRDSSGVFIYQHTDGKWYDHPVGQAQYVVNMLRNYRIKPDKVYLDLALANANRLLQRAVRHGGGIFFPYPFDFHLHGRGTMAAPWYSGMAQGIALSGFVRLHELTGDPKWLQAAHDTFASFLVPRQSGKPWVTVVDNGLLWFEEYPWTPYDHTFNGHNFATYGLYDYWRLTGSRDAAELTVGGITTAARRAGTVRVPGGISHYCISQSCLDRKVRNVDYHLTHIGQFIQLYRYTRNEAFARLADTFTADNPNFRSGGTVVFRPANHVGYTFNSSGVGSPARSLSLSSSSNAPYSTRTVPYGWIKPGNGIWFYMSDGYFAGTWIRESANAFARGFVDRLEYYWPRPLTVGAGSRTGYQFDSNGAVTVTKPASTGATTWQYTARAKVNGQPVALLSSGPLAGFWLPVGTSGGLSALSADAPPAIPDEFGEPQEPTADEVAPPLVEAPTDEAEIPPPMPGQQELAPDDASFEEGSGSRDDFVILPRPSSGRFLRRRFRQWGRGRTHPRRPIPLPTPARGVS